MLMLDCPPLAAYSPATVLRKIGRGSAIGKSLNSAEARELFDAMFAQQLNPAALGAVLLALRIKGETEVELLEAIAAIEPYLRPLASLPEVARVSIPSYNPARNLPNLTWLLAQLLANHGIQVVVHGLQSHAQKITSFQVAKAMGHEPVTNNQQAMQCFLERKPAFYSLSALCPELDSLIAMRNVLGVRNIGHTLVKLINPFANPVSLRLSSHTHPEFASLQRSVLASSNAWAMLSRATEGEVVSNVRKGTQFTVVQHNSCQEILAEPNNTCSSSAGTDPLPHHADLDATCRYIDDISSGKREVPAHIAHQVGAILGALECNSRLAHHG